MQRHLLCALLLPALLRAQTPLRTYADAVLQQYSRTAPKVDYTVTVQDGDRSAYFVELRIGNAPNPARLVVPDWAPGAYRLMDSGRNIVDLVALTESGDTLPVTRAGGITWIVDTRGAARVVVRYSAAIRDPQRWAQPNNRWFLGRTSGLIDGPRTFLYLDGWTLTPTHVTFRLPAGWGIGTGLVPTTDSSVYWAPSYDVLIDAPVLVGQFVTYRFTAGGVPHRAVVDLQGARPGYDEARFVEMLRRISETAIGIFGNAPYKDYTYIYVAGGGGGLEHLNSTTIGFSPQQLALDPTAVKGVTAHEFFHTWNVKRIRPVELGPFDYTRPVRTLNLWVSEGNTDYYTNVILVRSGIDSADAFVDNLEDALAQHRGNPARLVVSPERSSWTVWDSPEVNGGLSISYYLQGDLLGLMLDLTIRDSTDDAKSYDDVMRYLFDHYAGERGFTSEDLLNAVLAAAGLDLHDFWRKYVSGTAEIPWNDFLRPAGWQVTFREETVGRLPFRAALREGKIVVSRAGGGLLEGDEIVSLNGFDPRRPDFGRVLGPLAVDRSYRVTVRRGDRTLDLTVRGEALPDTRVFTLTPAREGGRPRARAQPGSAPARAGLRTGDELVRVNGQEIRMAGDVFAALRDVRLNEQITVEVLRDGAPQTIRFRAAPYAGVRAEVTDLAQMTEKMTRIRESLLTGR